MAGKGRIENLKPGGFARDKKAASEAGKKGGEVRRNKKRISECMKMLLEQEFEEVDIDGNKIKVTGAQKLALAAFKKGDTGDIAAIKEILERSEGKVKDIVEEKSERKLTVNFVDSED